MDAVASGVRKETPETRREMVCGVHPIQCVQPEFRALNGDIYRGGFQRGRDIFIR